MNSEIFQLDLFGHFSSEQLANFYLLSIIREAGKCGRDPETPSPRLVQRQLKLVTFRLHILLFNILIKYILDLLDITR